MKILYSLTSCLLAALLIIPVPDPVRAEETGDEADPDALETIHVTARKREEEIRDVPFAVSTLNSENLDDARIDGTEDLFRNVPNFGFNGFNSPRFSYYSIRGVGPLSQPLSPDDTSVVTYVDGVPQPLFGADLSFLDVERVEVLRGPQGTLFGRNTSGGAINITTRKPGKETEFGLRGEYGEEESAMGQAVASGSLIDDRLAARLAVRYKGAGSYVDNTEGGDLGAFDSFAGRGTVVLTPGESTTFTLGLFGQVDRNEPPIFVLFENDGYPEAAVTESESERRAGGASLIAEQVFDWATLTSTTGVNSVESQIDTDDTDGLIFGALFGFPPSFFAPETDFSDWDEEEISVSQELRLNSPEGSAFDWVGGLAYYHNSFDARYENQSGFFAATNGTRDVELTTNSLSAFGEVTVPLMEGLEATAGLRYSHDWKDYEATFTGNGFPGTVDFFEESGNLTYDYVTGRAALAYDLTEAVTVYGTVARGYKDGGFPRFPTDSAGGVATEPYESTVTWTYEAGAKSELFGGRAQVNVAAFLNEVSDEQLYAFDGGSGTFRPANVDLRSYGAEIEAALRLARGLDLTGSLGYTHARLRNVGDDLAAATGAEDGNRAPNVPEVGAAAALQYFGPAEWLLLPEDIDLLARIEYQY